MKTVLYNGKHIAYRCEGVGPTLVFLHGFPMDHRVWDQFVIPFQQQFQTIMIDLPGFGASELLAAEHPMWLMAQAVDAVLVAEKIEKALLIGHSMGGYVSLAFAKQFSAKLTGLVLFHSHAMPDDDVAKASRAVALTQIETDAVAYVSNFINGLFSPDFDAKYPENVGRIKEIALEQQSSSVKAAVAGLRDRESQLQLLSETKLPLLFILGKDDSRMPFARIMAQLALPAHAELLLLGEVGHMGFEEAATITSEAILHFAQRFHRA